MGEQASLLRRLTRPRVGRRLKSAVVLCVGMATLVRAAPLDDHLDVGPPTVLRIALTTFAPQEVTKIGRFRQLNRLLRSLSVLSDRDAVRSDREASAFPGRVDFDVTIGNYYQVFAWLRQGVVDGAVVSPLVARLLIGSGQFVPLLEFASASGNGALEAEHPELAYRGQWPKLRARMLGEPSEAPLGDYDRFLHRLYRLARRPDIFRPERHSRYRLRMVCHLSTSGFLVPILHARDVLRQDMETARRRKKRGAGDREAEATQRRFWDLYRRHIRLTFTHQSGTEERRCRPGAPCDPRHWRDFFFTVTGVSRAVEQLPSSLYPPLSGYPRLGRSQDALLLPNDVLVVRLKALPNDMAVLSPELVLRVLAAIHLDQRAGTLPNDTVALDQHFDPGEAEAPYAGVRAYDAEMHGELDRMLREVKADLGQPALDWYEGGTDYDFSLTEALDLIRLDQQTSGHKSLAVVLPGGGVKSAYQARVLDALYGRDKLRNRYTAELGDRDVIVDTIVGTSGGALTGIFAAMQPPGIPPPEQGIGLTDFWIKKHVVQIDARDIFPPLDFPRWLSILAISAVTWGVFLSLSLTRWKLAGTPTHFVREEGFRASSATLLLTLLFAPAMIAMFQFCITWKRPEVIHSEAGFFYFLSFITVHAFVSRDAQNRMPRRSKRFLAGSLLVILVVSTAAVRLVPWGSPNRVALDAATLALLAVMIVIGFWVRWPLRRITTAYLNALTPIVAVVLLTYACLFELRRREWISLLEFDGSFWWALIACSVASSAVVYAVARRIDYLRRGIIIMSADHRFLSRRWRRFSSLLITGLWAMAAWNLSLAPALYQNAIAQKTFRRQLCRATAVLQRSPPEGCDHDWEPEPLNLSTKLIATASLTDDLEKVGDNPAMEAGDLYVEFLPKHEGAADGFGRRERWKPGDLHFEEVQNVIFASGAAFPVFAPHTVSVDHREARLIDGGFAHNVPIEAAEAAGARQLLIVYSSARASAALARSAWYEQALAVPQGALPGYLAGYITRIFNFLFERAQALDQRIASHLMVVSIFPDGPGRVFPFLGSFTKSNIERLVQYAEEDIREEARPARVQGWGLPIFRMHVEAHPAPF